MAIGEVRGLEAARLDVDGAPPSEEPARAAPDGEARVARTPLTQRPDPTRVERRTDAAPRALDPLRGAPSDFLTNGAERDAYRLITEADRPIGEILDRFDGLSPGSYNRVLHALSLTPASGGPSLLDSIVARGASEPSKTTLAARFFAQLERKLVGQPGRILERLAPDARARLQSQPGFSRIATMLGEAG